MKECKDSDSKLVSLYRQGDAKAFEMLFNRHQSRLYTAICFIVKDRDEAEDILQDVFIRVVNTIRDGKYKEEGKFIHWIGRMAHNLAIDRYRQNQNHPKILLQDDKTILDTLRFSEESAEAKQTTMDTHSHLRELIRTLPEEQRRVLIMRLYLKMSFQEIASRTGVSINTALGRMRYALIHLKKKMKTYDSNVYKKQQCEKVPRDHGGRFA